MLNEAPYEAIDYLIIGHLSKDRTPEGFRLGGTAAYSALTARALGLRVGIVTAWSEDLVLKELHSIPIAGETADQSTSFENTEIADTRQQIIHHHAPMLDYYHIPEPWRAASIVHLGPIAQEVEPSMVRHFPEAQICLTAQGWLRDWDESGHVYQSEWPEASYVLDHVDATVISLEDISSDETRIEEMTEIAQILVVTEGEQGARVFYQDEERCLPAPQANEIDSTGAGDIFATAFFIHLQRTGNLWISAEFANRIASISVTRPGLDGIPRPDEIYSAYSTQMKV